MTKDFNVKVHKMFTDTISYCTVQLAFKNYYILSFDLISKKKILSIKLHFPTTGLCEVSEMFFLTSNQKNISKHIESRSRYEKLAVFH